MNQRQFNGVTFGGIIFQKAQTVNEPARGISFERPDRFLLTTPYGQLEVNKGDWVVEMPSGNHYLIKDSDIAALGQTSNRKWWKIW